MSTTKNNDEIVAKLFAKAQAKKAEIAKAEKPNYVTNCSFGYDRNSSARINIQTLTDTEEFAYMLGFLIQKEEGYKKGKERLKTKENEEIAEFKWLGFTVAEWEGDFKQRIAKIQILSKKKELEDYEERLDKLISADKRAEMEIEAISKGLE